MSIEFSQASDLEVAQHLSAAVMEAAKRGLLRKSYLHIAPIMASTALQLAALKAAGLPTERKEAKDASQ